MIETNTRNIIHPRERFVALSLCTDSNLRDLTTQTDNVQKTSFPFGCSYKWCSQPQDSIDVCFDPPCPHSHQPLLASDNLDWLSRRQNYEKKSRKISFFYKNLRKICIIKENVLFLKPILRRISDKTVRMQRHTHTFRCENQMITEPVGIP